MANHPRSFEPRRARRIVVKVGSAVIAPGGLLETASIKRLADDVSACMAADPTRRFVLVSSGAVASGFRSLGLDRPPKRIADKQAAAAIGQPRLMAAWAEAFGKTPTAQVLLTSEDIDHRGRFLNARHTLERLLAAGVIPVVNENDSVSFEEIKVGDNDRLSALVASLVGADLLLILSSVGGVYARGTKRIVPEVRSLAEGLGHVTSERSATGVGGMGTKVRAACEAASLGVPVVVAGGETDGVVLRVLAGEPIGTHFPTPGAESKSRAARERWIGFAARPKGVLIVDEGARRAITARGASLLPSGIVGVEGTFEIGGLVEIRGPGGETLTRGLASYAADDLLRIRGLKASEIEAVLGYRYADEAVHRDDLVLLAEPKAERTAHGD